LAVKKNIRRLDLSCQLIYGIFLKQEIIGGLVAIGLKQSKIFLRKEK